MTDKEQAFVDSIARNLEGIDFCSSGSYLQDCPDCPGDIDYENGVNYDCESYFSWQGCDSCGSPLGGAVEPAHGRLVESDEIIHMEWCVDCVLYHANGDLPDFAESR